MNIELDIELDIEYVLMVFIFCLFIFNESAPVVCAY